MESIKKIITMHHDDHDMYSNTSYKLPANSDCIKFLGLNIDEMVSWKNHINYLVTQLSSACFIMRAFKPIMSPGSLRMISFAYIHSVLTYGIIFWGNSSYTIKVFKIQKKVIRIIMGLKKYDSCRNSLKK
jgi:hypothetical protein